jgi:hypothetical protein
MKKGNPALCRLALLAGQETIASSFSAVWKKSIQNIVYFVLCKNNKFSDLTW